MLEDLTPNLEIMDVLDSGFIKELQTGAWKKQLNKGQYGKFEVEVYWFPWVHEGERRGHWFRIYCCEAEAQAVYDSLTSLRRVKKILVRDA